MVSSSMGLRTGDCGIGSRIDKTVSNPHGFIIHGIEVFKGNEKVTEVIDIENWRVDNSRLLRWIVSLFKWNSFVLSTKSLIQSTFRPSHSIESNTSDLQNSNSSISKHGESSSRILSKPMIKFVKAADSPTVIKTNKVETVRKPSVKYAEMYRNTSKSPKVKGISQVEARLVEYKTQEVKFCETIKGLDFDLESKNNKIKHLMNELEQVKKEKDGLDSKLTRFLSAINDSDTLLGSQRSDKNKEGLGYSVVPPPAQVYSPP
nr:hypothetical protein [Tanacetum cinerariifolium]